MTFYITTPLYYVNDKPHLGTAYTTILADVLHRYHQLIDYESFLMTGTDEHGQKCVESAKKQNKEVKDHCDQMVKQFKAVWQSLDISYNRFFRTTAPFHKEAVQKYLKQLHDQNYIYESTYEGWYCVSEEIFYTEKDLIHGKSPSGKEVHKIKEKNYFFKMSAFQQALLEHIKKNPGFIKPAHKKNEVLGFLKKDLADLCISRPKTRVDWGIELPFDTKYVTYVWVDALLNYVTGLNQEGSISKKEPESEFEKWWNKAGAHHLIGKDILITHAVYWPCLLMALGIKLPKTILAHGWLLNQEQEKMSKSTGDVMDPLDLLKIYSSDTLRYFLIRNLSIEKDSPISHALIKGQINEDLSNNLGNLISRTFKMIHNYFDSQIPKRGTDEEALAITNLRKKAQSTLEVVKQDVLNLRPHRALEHIINLLNEANRFLENQAPWKSIKTNREETAKNLRMVLEVIYISAVLLKPVMPRSMAFLLKSLNCPEEWPEKHFQTGIYPKAGTKIKEIAPMFPRLNQTGFEKSGAYEVFSTSKENLNRDVSNKTNLKVK